MLTGRLANWKLLGKTLPYGSYGVPQTRSKIRGWDTFSFCLKKSPVNWCSLLQFWSVLSCVLYSFLLMFLSFPLPFLRDSQKGWGGDMFHDNFKGYDGETEKIHT